MASRCSCCVHCGETIYTDAHGAWRHYDSHLVCCDDSEVTQAEP
jgi:hypothetical protein